MPDLLRNLHSFYGAEDFLDGRPISNDLTQTGTVTSVPGKIGNAWDFANDAVNNHLSRLAASTDGIDGVAGESFSLSLFFKMHAVGNADVFGKITHPTQTTGISGWSFRLGGGANSIPSFGYGRADNNEKEFNNNTSITTLINTWYHVVCVHEVGVGHHTYLDAVDSLNSDFSYTGDIAPAAANDLLIARHPSGNKFKGVMDLVGFWKNRALQQVDVSWLRNGGAGKNLADIVRSGRTASRRIVEGIYK